MKKREHRKVLISDEEFVTIQHALACYASVLEEEANNLYSRGHSGLYTAMAAYQEEYTKANNLHHKMVARWSSAEAQP